VARVAGLAVARTISVHTAGRSCNAGSRACANASLLPSRAGSGNVWGWDIGRSVRGRHDHRGIRQREIGCSVRGGRNYGQRVDAGLLRCPRICGQGLHDSANFSRRGYRGIGGTHVDSIGVEKNGCADRIQGLSLGIDNGVDTRSTSSVTKARLTRDNRTIESALFPIEASSQKHDTTDREQYPSLVHDLLLLSSKRIYAKRPCCLLQTLSARLIATRRLKRQPDIAQWRFIDRRTTK
jgi:hypothetical protein